MTTLYRFFGGDALLYIGITGRPWGRWKAHEQRKDWWQRVTRVVVEHYPSRGAALFAEAIAIRQERPLYNVVGRSNESLVAPDSGIVSAVFDALFCWGEERQCWFSPSGISRLTGFSVETLIAACLALRDNGTIDLRFEGADSLYVVQRGAAG